jgi:TatD DNase family protein
LSAGHENGLFSPGICEASMLIDTHAHLDQEEFDADRDEVVARAASAGVGLIVAIGTTATSSARVVELAVSYPGVYAAVGIQPNYCGEARAGDWNRILELFDQPKVVAVGESGLDRHWDFAPFEVQQDYFDRHLRAAQEKELPIVIHTRDSDADVVAMLRDARKRGTVRGVMHSFTGTAETMNECVELGFHISFAGMLTFKKSQDLREVAAAVPADRLLIETDSPYLSPHPLRGQRNEPAHLIHTAQCLASVRGTDVNSIWELTTANARQLFRLP